MIASVYLDTNAFIAAFESAGERADAMVQVFDSVAAEEFIGITSELTLAELLPKPLALGQTELSDFYEQTLSGQGSIQVVPVSRSILLATGALRALHPTLKLPDAIHLGSAVARACTLILSNDRRLPSPPVFARSR